MGDEGEKYVFDTPTVVVAPAGFHHNPVVTRKADKPYSFSAICLNGEHETTWLGGENNKILRKGGLKWPSESFSTIWRST